VSAPTLHSALPPPGPCITPASKRPHQHQHQHQRQRILPAPLPTYASCPALLCRPLAATLPYPTLPYPTLPTISVQRTPSRSPRANPFIPSDRSAHVLSKLTNQPKYLPTLPYLTYVFTSCPRHTIPTPSLHLHNRRLLPALNHPDRARACRATWRVAGLRETMP
jgi:hypothetical protein